MQLYPEKVYRIKMINLNLKTTIVIPTYNRNKLLLKVLPSYLRQKYVEKIIIVDDGSTVETNKYLEKNRILSDKIEVFRHYRSLGLPSARNTGILNAKTPWIFFGEDDLIISDNHIEILHKYKRKLKADIVCGKVLIQENDETLERAEELT